jgi:hypothetical protein
MDEQNDQHSTSIVALLSDHSRTAARVRDVAHSGQAARAVGSAQPLVPRWLVGRPRVTGLALAAAGWAATVAAVIVGGHLGRGAAAQISFAAAMIIFALGETLISPALPTMIDDRAPHGAAGRHAMLGTSALVTGCLLVPSVCRAALGADWGTSLLTTLAVACAVASVAAHRRGRRLAARSSQTEVDHVQP